MRLERCQKYWKKVQEMLEVKGVWATKKQFNEAWFTKWCIEQGKTQTIILPNYIQQQNANLFVYL